jgi:hypothetical protein
VRDTVIGEPEEIFAFLGSSRLEEPLARYPLSAVFHGHAHSGSAEGKLTNGVPVYNVSMPLLSRLYPDRPPFRIVELTADQSLNTADAHATDGALIPWNRAQGLG